MSNSVDHVLFGAAYYDEYMPDDRIETDMAMMRQAGITTIRIGESTWSTCEPQPGVFDFSHIDRALDAASAHGIEVIVGTPTYAVPTWLVAMQPDVLAETPHGKGRYGARQIMDIVNASYRYYAQRIIRHMVAHVAPRPAVIGFQVDNETKYYDSVSPDMQRMFVKSLREQFDDDLDRLNAAFGLDYWSNRINAWEDFPDVTGTINASLAGQFDRFRRTQVAEFLSWQADIVREYARDDQFVTHNFDFDWGPGWSYGVQPAVDHFEAAKSVDIAGVDIYHPTEDDLTGKEIAFGGDMMRSVKGGNNYLVLETEAQGQHGWLPYPGQLRLQAYSHLASGADGVMYWHWHSIHNSYETYWKGLLSHDLESNPTYEEAGVFGRQIARPEVGERLVHLRKRNRVAIMVNNESLTALTWFSVETGFPSDESIGYNDVVRRVYDALFELNVECDFVSVRASAAELARYALVMTPALYCASQSTLDVLRKYVADGGHLVSTMRSFVADEQVTVWHDHAPHALADVFGMSYNQFTRPKHVGVSFVGCLAEAFEESGTVESGIVEAGALGAESLKAQALIELLKPDADTQALATYEHYAWHDYAAITRHRHGSGDAEWIGTLLPHKAMKAVLAEAVRNAGIDGPAQRLAGTVTVREGDNSLGEHVTYLLNYSPEPVQIPSPVEGESLIGHAHAEAGTHICEGDPLEIAPWDLAILVR